MRVLIACEFSAIVCQAFRERGHEAFSNDLLPTEGNPIHHIQGDADMACRQQSWDLLIAHPPCTYLCNSGVRWLAPGGKLDSKRHKLMMQAADFFAALYWSGIPRACIENPVMHCYAKDYLQSAWKIPGQTMTFQPWQHGEPEVKRSCLWLRGLSPLVPSNIVEGRSARVHRESPGPDRWKNRSRTLKGVALAMSQQWG